MNQLTEEQQERVKRIREQRHAATLPKNQRGLLHTASWVDIAFLLSLLDAQTRDTAGLEYHSKECAVDEEGNDCDCGAYRRNQAFLAQRTLLDSDSQAATVSASAHELAVEWSQSTSDDGVSVDDINRLAQLIDQRATAMRDKCVETVKAIHEERLKDLRSLVEKGEVEHEDAEYERAVLFVLSNAINAMRSLTLDQVKPGEM